MSSDYKHSLIDKIISHEDKIGRWNVINQNYPHFNEWNYYVPTYNSTFWTLVLLADIKSNYQRARFKRLLGIMSAYLYDKDNGIFTIKNSHFPIPCVNGNMLYLHNYFETGKNEKINAVIDFFDEYQRFDDGDYKSSSECPYFSNKNCYGRHSCYWAL